MRRPGERALLRANPIAAEEKLNDFVVQACFQRPEQLGGVAEEELLVAEADGALQRTFDVRALQLSEVDEEIGDGQGPEPARRPDNGQHLTARVEGSLAVVEEQSGLFQAGDSCRVPQHQLARAPQARHGAAHTYSPRPDRQEEEFRPLGGRAVTPARPRLGKPVLVARHDAQRHALLRRGRQRAPEERDQSDQRCRTRRVRLHRSA